MTYWKQWPLYRQSRKLARAAVRERDGDLCWICGREVIEGLPEGHEDYATVDHVVERCRGGSDELDNLALAHFKCNQERSAPLGDKHNQPAFQRLIGMVMRMVEGSNGRT